MVSVGLRNTLIWIVGLKVFSLQKRIVVDSIFRLRHFLCTKTTSIIPCLIFSFSSSTVLRLPIHKPFEPKKCQKMRFSVFEHRHVQKLRTCKSDITDFESCLRPCFPSFTMQIVEFEMVEIEIRLTLNEQSCKAPMHDINDGTKPQVLRLWKKCCAWKPFVCCSFLKRSIEACSFLNT